MFVLTRNPRKLIVELAEGKAPVQKGYISCPDLKQDPVDTIVTPPDIEIEEFHTKKIIYGQKDIEV